MPARFRSLAGRLRGLALMLWALASLLFVLLRLTGDPATVLAGQDATPETIAAIRAEYGLDRPWPVQYLAYLGQLATLDFGRSLTTGRPALTLALQHLVPTLEVGALAIALTVALALTIGAWLGAAPERPERRLVSALVFVAQGVPGFVTGLVLIRLVAVDWQALPSMGGGDLRHAVLPVLTLTAFLAPKLARLVAANVTEAMGQDYVRTARANGATAQAVLWRHALPNALLPAAALIGTQVAYLLSGAVVTETLFAWPGIGWLLLQSTQLLDFPVVEATVLLVALLVFAANALADMGFRRLDPRLSHA